MRSVMCSTALAFSLCGLACGFGEKPTASKPGEKTAEVKKVYTRDEFRKLAVGKTPDELIQTIGRPESTRESGSDQYWTYKQITKDPVTDKVDDHAQVVIEKGKVDRVNY